MPYNEDKIKFQTYSWVIGTTSFRVPELKYKNERQLIRLKEFKKNNSGKKWIDLQNKYFDILLDEGFSTNRDKDIKKVCRTKTSGLQDLGLINSERDITHIGNKLLDIIIKKDFNYNNIFGIRNDSFLYLLQFLKIEFSENVESNAYNNFKIKPLISLIYMIVKLGGKITKDIFTYILPIIQNNEELINNTNLLIEGNIDIDEILFKNIKEKENYSNSLLYFLENEKNDSTFKKVFLNRKSGNYDLKYKCFYELIISYSVSDSYSTKIVKLKTINNFITSLKIKSDNIYYKYLFNFDKKLVNSNFNQDLINHFESENYLFANINKLDENFFYLVHLGKWKSNLEEYEDLNIRYFDLTDIFIFEKDKISLDEVAFNIFEDILDDLLDINFSINKEEYNSNIYSIIQIDEIENINKDELLQKLKSKFPELGEEENITNAIKEIKDKRKIERFNELIDDNFTKNDINKLLNNIKQRKIKGDLYDNKILNYKSISNNKIGWEADTSTIFEYIVGISWYIISGKEGDLTKFLNLDLDSNLLPRRFAGGGQADIIFNYDNHDLIIEVTLSNKDNQKKMELEPVPRHLGRYILENNGNHYALFIAPYLDPNVLVNFRAYKSLKYYNTNDTSKYVNNLKIIPLDIDDLITIINSGKDYNFIKDKFEEIYNNSDNLDGFEWRNNILKNNISNFNEN